MFVEEGGRDVGSETRARERGARALAERVAAVAVAPVGRAVHVLFGARDRSIDCRRRARRRALAGAAPPDQPGDRGQEPARVDRPARAGRLGRASSAAGGAMSAHEAGAAVRAGGCLLLLVVVGTVAAWGVVQWWRP